MGGWGGGVNPLDGKLRLAHSSLTQSSFFFSYPVVPVGTNATSLEDPSTSRTTRPNLAEPGQTCAGRDCRQGWAGWIRWRTTRHSMARCFRSAHHGAEERGEPLLGDARHASVYQALGGQGRAPLVLRHHVHGDLGACRWVHKSSAGCEHTRSREHAGDEAQLAGRPARGLHPGGNTGWRAHQGTGLGWLWRRSPAPRAAGGCRGR